MRLKYHRGEGQRCLGRWLLEEGKAGPAPVLERPLRSPRGGSSGVALPAPSRDQLLLLQLENPFPRGERPSSRPGGDRPPVGVIMDQIRFHPQLSSAAVGSRKVRPLTWSQVCKAVSSMRAPVLGIYRFPKFVLINFDFKNLETKSGIKTQERGVGLTRWLCPSAFQPPVQMAWKTVQNFLALLVQSIPHLGKNPNEAKAQVWVTEWGEKEEQACAEEPQV